MTLGRFPAFKPLCSLLGLWDVTLPPGDPLPGVSLALAQSLCQATRDILDPAERDSCQQATWSSRCYGQLLIGAPGNDLDWGIRYENFMPCPEQPGSCAPCWHKLGGVHSAKASASVAETVDETHPGVPSKVGKGCVLNVLKPGQEGSGRMGDLALLLIGMCP